MPARPKAKPAPARRGRRRLSEYFMSPRRADDPAPYGGPTAMIATATIRPRHLAARTSDNWAAMAWQQYDFCGELRYALNWKANAISRARLYIGKLGDGDANPVPVEAGEAAEAQQALAELFGGPSGQSMMLRTSTLHLGVVGDSYVVGWDTPAVSGVDSGQAPASLSGEDVRHWVVRAPEEIEEATGDTIVDGVAVSKISVKLDGVDYTLPDECIVIRIWDQHPRYSWQSDSPTRGVLPVLHELERLTQMIIAQANSRLAGAGILLVPKEMDFPKEKPAPPASEIVVGQTRVSTGDPEVDAAAAPPPPQAEPSIHTLMARLQEAMTTPITERDDPSAIVPIGMSGPAAVLKEVRHITFWTELDASAIELRKEAIRRLALGLDVPPEIVLGIGSSTNHWNGWQIERSAITLCVEPLLARMCDALTRGYLRPYLGSTGDADRYVIWFDTSELVQQPDRGPVALQLYEVEAISHDALLRSNGFSVDDKPSALETANRALRSLLNHAASDAQLTRAILEKLKFLEALEVAATPVTVPAATGPLPGTATVAGTKQATAPADTAADGKPVLPVVPSGPGASAARVPRQVTAALTADAAAAITGVAKVLVAHALDHAGKKWLKGQPRSIHKTGVSPMRLHEAVPVPADRAPFLLEGAWAGMGGAAAPELLDAVGGYVHGLLIAGQPHSDEALGAALAAAYLPA